MSRLRYVLAAWPLLAVAGCSNDSSPAASSGAVAARAVSKEAAEQRFSGEDAAAEHAAGSVADDAAGETAEAAAAPRSRLLLAPAEPGLSATPARDHLSNLDSYRTPTVVGEPIPTDAILGRRNAATPSPSTVKSDGTVAAAAPTPSPLPALQKEVQQNQRLGEAVVEEFDTESYAHQPENGFRVASREPLSTFSIDVDTASYSNVRRFLTGGHAPPAGAVRIEELVNYFDYGYAPPTGDEPVAVHVEVAGCPWNTDHRLARIALKGREIDFDRRPVSNLVFLLDVSGSMQQQNKLPYVKDSLRLMLDRLGENDRVAIVVYAGAAGLVLPSTTADRKETILAAIDNLQAGGSTNGAGGIRLAYDVATENFVKGGTNRIVLCTDGDFNVGPSSESELVNLIEGEAKRGVFLTVLGFGMGNYQDSKMEQLADKGNGDYAYIDTLNEAKKVLSERLSGTLITIAKDVKIQVDFNPAKVAAYRLIGYENRTLAAADFKDDKNDAGEIGAGHAVTALYELIPPGQPVPGDVDPSKYQATAAPTPASDTDELLTVRLRYKRPDEDASVPFEVPVKDAGEAFDDASGDFQFAAAVAEFSLLLRRSQYAPKANWDSVREIAAGAKGEDSHGYRAEFLTLVDRAAKLSK